MALIGNPVQRSRDGSDAAGQPLARSPGDPSLPEPRSEPARRLGRFELRRTLGRGAQATVWLAHDPRLDRPVALKVLDAQTDLLELDQWLHEARTVSRLSHPNIVPVFEADLVDGQACLVFEYVEGPTLAQVLRQRGSLPAREAVNCLLGVLDALDAAHQQGVVHRDLKPSNILVGSDSRPRVMDFGIAARVSTGRDGRIVGTPAFMSPEAARGEAPSPRMDVFSAGLLLARLLTGVNLLDGPDVWDIIRRVSEEDLQLPAHPEVDDALRRVIGQALARDATKRYADAAALRRALASWCEAVPVSAAPAVAGPGAGTLDFLLRRMRHKTDFPALSAAVSRIQRIADSDSETLDNLSQAILEDVALTNKLLRMVNSAHFGHVAGGGIGTVSRAVALVGFAGIRNMALSLVLLEHMQDKEHALALREEYMRALLSAELAARLAGAPRESEEAFLAALFQNLGRLLAGFYLADEARQIREQVEPTQEAGVALVRPVAESVASAQVLGISYDALGQGVAQAWGLPEALRAAMSKPEGEPPARRIDRPSERLRWLGRLARDVSDQAWLSPADRLDGRVRTLAERHARALDCTPDAVLQALQHAREAVKRLVFSAGMGVPPTSAVNRLLPGFSSSAEGRASEKGGAAATMQRGQVGGDRSAASAPSTPSAPPGADALLSAGIQDITDSMVSENFRLSQVLRMIVETLYRGMGFRCVVLALLEKSSGSIVGRHGLGEPARDIAGLLKVPTRRCGAGWPDLISSACAQGLDLMFGEQPLSAPVQGGPLPPWHLQYVGQRPWMMLPLMHKGSAIGLIYADRESEANRAIGDREAALMRTLRNQAVMAIRQSARVT